MYEHSTKAERGDILLLGSLYSMWTGTSLESR